MTDLGEWIDQKDSDITWTALLKVELPEWRQDAGVTREN